MLLRFEIYWIQFHIKMHCKIFHVEYPIFKYITSHFKQYHKCCYSSRYNGYQGFWGQRRSWGKLLGGEISEKREFLEKISRGTEGAAKNCPFYQIFRRYWGGGQNPILPPLTRHWGGICPPPPKNVSGGEWGHLCRNTFEFSSVCKNTFFQKWGFFEHFRDISKQITPKIHFLLLFYLEIFPKFTKKVLKKF